MPKKKLPDLSDYHDIEVEKTRKKGDKEFTYFLRVPFEYVQKMEVSIANKPMVNLSSGLYRQLYYSDGTLFDANGARVFIDELLTGKHEMRAFHWTYEKHMEKMGIIDENGLVLVPAIVNGMRDLGQNSWHVFWEKDPGLEFFLEGTFLGGKGYVSLKKRQKDRWFRLLEDDIYGTMRATALGNDFSTGRSYRCLTIPTEGNPTIQNLKFDEKQDVYSSDLETKLSDSILWAVSGKELVTHGIAMDPMDILEQYCGDPAHIIPVSRQKPVTPAESGISDRPREKPLLEKLFEGYPLNFKENCLTHAKGLIGAAKYYFDVVGVDGTSLMILHKYGTLKEVGDEAVRRGMTDGIVVDEGGSIALWAWHHGPNGGYENVSSYFRPSAISLFGIILKNPGG
ncbi:hypothetical protein HYU14_04365 [Candidatus Woesearchaeota archaeon]|nr:hypothetical protein [Candidatus Woesearchaeota archaeon]